MKKESRTTYRTDKTTHEQLDAASKRLNVPKSCLIDQFVRIGLAKLNDHQTGWLSYK